MNTHYGWNDYFRQQLDTLYPGLEAARVLEVHGEIFVAALPDEIIEVPLSGRLRYQACDRLTCRWPATGSHYLR